MCAGENIVMAERDLEGLPALIKKTIKASNERQNEGLAEENFLINPINTLPKETAKRLWSIASDLNFRPLLVILKVNPKPS